MKFSPSFPRCAALIGALLALAGCTGIPANTLKLVAPSDESRELQTHHYDGVAETTLLTASAGVLQDLGFTLDESESKLGVVTATRKLTSHRSLNTGEVVGGLIGVALLPTLGGISLAYHAAKGVKEPQRVRVCLVTRADGAGATRSSSVRVTAQRILYVDEQFTRVKMATQLNDVEFYQEFFTRLNKSVFLEVQKS